MAKDSVLGRLQPLKTHFFESGLNWTFWIGFDRTLGATFGVSLTFFFLVFFEVFR
jgi:hypothetical protein